MKEKNSIIKTIECLLIIPIYYIVGDKSIFLYVLSLSLYNIFSSCFKHISIKDTLSNLKSNYNKDKFLKLTILTIGVFCAAFLLLSILISDIMSSVLKINNLFIVFLMMGISLIAEPIINVITDYLESTKNKKAAKNLFNLYYLLDLILLLIISLFVFRVFNLKENIAISLLYLSKIISLITVLVLSILLVKLPSTKNLPKEKVNYREELKKILTKNNYKSIIDIAQKSYYYISIIVLYIILTTRYGYANNQICEILTFIYFYGFTIINYLIYSVESLIKYLQKNKYIIDSIYKTFNIMLTISIILGFTSPLICKLLFNDPSNSIYLIMLNFLSIFIALYNITFKNIKNKRLIYISLIAGLLFKIILIIPLINSFYRVGYNLIYGDIISTIIGMFLSTIINYLYIKTKIEKEGKYLEQILKSLYENLLLCIILILLQFIVPIETNSYFKSLGIIIIYLSISLLVINLKKKRGK